MAGDPRTAVLNRLRQFAGAGALSDSQLLERFVRDRDEAAFEVLVRRHGPMVLGVCRRLLRPQDAEDAFQATFLVLVRKAASLGRRELLANWLYGVAYKVSARLRGTLWRRRTVALPAADVPLWTPPSPDDGAAVHEEVHRLPAKYRQPVVLCYFEGKTNEEAARQLGWPAGTVAGRLARARALLRKRLKRRGLALGAAWGAAELARLSVGAAVPAGLTAQTVKGATLIALGQGLAGGALSPSATVLAEGVVKTMFVSKLKAAAVAVLVGVLGTGAGVVGHYRLIGADAQGEVGRAAAKGQAQLLAASPAPAPAHDELTPEMMRLIQELATAQIQLQARQANAVPLDHGRIVQQTVQSIQNMGPEDRHRYLRRLPDAVLQMHRKLDPFYLLPEDEKGATKVPPAVAAEVAKLLSDDVDTYLAARRQVLHLGAACKVLVAEHGRKLPSDSPKRLRLLAVLGHLEVREKEDQVLRLIDEGLHRSAELAKARKNTTKKVAVLFARQGVSDQVPWQQDPLRTLCYFSFPKGANGYDGAVSLEFGNGGDYALQANMYGGQENRLKDLGPVEFESVKRAPSPDDIKKWGDPRNARLKATLGHVYLEHCSEERDNINTVVKFKVLAMKPGVWLILEYEVLGPPHADA